MRRKNSKILCATFSWLMLSICAIPLYAQEPEFTASVSGNTVVQNAVFEIHFELQNASGSSYQAPSFQDFKVVGGPSTSSSTMIVNGAVSRSQSWSYSLLATKPGKFAIGVASVIVGRNKLTTRPIAIEVVAPGSLSHQSGTSSKNDPVFLKAEVDGSNYYPGQQIILTYRLLFRENVQTVSTIAEDDYADFFIQNFGSFSREATYETINGLQYTSRIVKSMALFAHQSGTYTIDPMLTSAGINAPFPGNQGFFAMRRIQDVQVASESLSITILPLPPGAPASFSGAVGQYQILTIPGNTDISTDNAFTFQLQITGNGDSRRWDPPSAVVNGDFETYDPKIIEDKMFEERNLVSNSRSISYQMIPALPGDYDVYVPITFFDPERKQYVTISSDTMHLHVTQGQNKPGEFRSGQQVTTNLITLMEIHHNWLKDRFWFSIPHLFLFGLVISGSCFGWFVSLKRRRQKLLPEIERIRAAAGFQARRQFDELEASLQDMPSKVFFEKASEIYYKFLMDRFAIPPSDLEESQLATYLTKTGVSEAASERAKRLFNLCLTVRYGATPGGYTMKEMLLECRESISLLEG